MLRERGLKVMFPQRTVATVDHIVPTESQARPFMDSLAEEMIQALEKNCQDYGVRFYNIGSGSQGIVHVIAPEQGLTQPGMTIALVGIAIPLPMGPLARLPSVLAPARCEMCLASQNPGPE